MGAGITLDATKWNRIIENYSDATHKSAAYACNRAMGVLMYHSSTNIKIANEGEIDALRSKSWFPKLIAKRLSARRAVLAERKVNMMDTSTVKGATRALKRRARLSHYTRKQAQAYAIKFVNQRFKAVRFLQAFFVAGSMGFRKFAGGGLFAPRGGWKKFDGLDPVFKYATKDDISAGLDIEYIYARRSQETADNANVLMQQAMDSAVPMASDDIVTYTERKLIENGRQIPAAAT